MAEIFGLNYGASVPKQGLQYLRPFFVVCSL